MPFPENNILFYWAAPHRGVLFYWKMRRRGESALSDGRHMQFECRGAHCVPLFLLRPLSQGLQPSYDTPSVMASPCHLPQRGRQGCGGNHLFSAQPGNPLPPPVFLRCPDKKARHIANRDIPSKAGKAGQKPASGIPKAVLQEPKIKRPGTSGRIRGCSRRQPPYSPPTRSGDCGSSGRKLP